MKLTYATLTAATFLLGSTGLSQAGTIASPAFPTGTEAEAACYVRNVGTTPISVEVTTFENFGVELAPTFDNCNGAPLAAGRTCVLLVNPTFLPDDVTVACSAVTSGSKTNLRGTLELRDALDNLKVFIAEDLR